MKKQNYNVVGVMSGTSLDGVDLAHIRFSILDAKWEYEVLECETISYSENWINTLKKAVDFSQEELVSLDIGYTKLLSDIINRFITKNKIANLDAVCSHGHTILHQPQNGVTLQIGNLPEIASYIKETVICNFRVKDVQLGGQGAPLVPIGDRILFPEYDYCLNLGGFSNVSFEKDSDRVAFDISPVNTVLNFYANKLNLPYDDKGKLAKEGNVCIDLLSELNALEFYQKKFPKSLGFEFVKQIVLPIIEKYNISTRDVLATFTTHIAQQIAAALPTKKGKLLITGGGAYNDFLLQLLTENLPSMEIVLPETKTIEFKEALIFGLLGVLKYRNDINVLSSVTGANRDHCSGDIFIFDKKK